jgi:hypothetical protein
MKTQEFERLVSKFGLKTRNSGDRLAWFEYDGKVVTRTKRSQGNKEQPGHFIRQQLKLNEVQMSDALNCSLKLNDYVEILRNRGLIPKAKGEPQVNPAPEKAQPK